jgi:hypothetical protein
VPREQNLHGELVALGDGADQKIVGSLPRIGPDATGGNLCQRATDLHVSPRIQFAPTRG